MHKASFAFTVFHSAQLAVLTRQRIANRNSLAPPCGRSSSTLSFVAAGGGERMLESGAVPSQDGAGRGPDGEGLAAAPDEKPESQHQLEAPLLFSPLLTPGPLSQLRLHPPASFRAGGRDLAVQWKEGKTETPSPSPPLTYTFVE